MINKINSRNSLFCLMLFGMIASMNAQTLDTVTPQVIASGGGFDTLNMTVLGNISVSYTVGEPIGETYNQTASPFTNVKWLTQGFQQPLSTSNTLSVQLISNNSTCIGANNGSVLINLTTFTGPVQYNWNGAGFGNTNLFTNLSPGLYYYQITDGSFTINDSVIISEDAIDCGAQLIFYASFTPNGDGKNDLWIIDGITNFTTNTVFIFNRWGDLVWNTNDYDNVSDDKVWDGTFSKTKKPLPDATYFYVISAGDKTYKGWIELVH